MTKKEYRRMCETMDTLLMPFVGHLKEVEKNYVESALRILRENRQDWIPLSVIEDIKAEIELIKEAEYQIYGKGSWNFVGKCLDVIDKHTSGVKTESKE